MIRHLIFIAVLLFSTSGSHGQSVTNRLVFEPGQEIQVFITQKITTSQEIMGRSIDFNTDLTGHIQYKVTNTNEENTTLKHKVKRITFSFEGMGQNRSFDSDNPENADDPMAKSLVQRFSSGYDMIIDSAGKVIMVVNEKKNENEEAASSISMFSAFLQQAQVLFSTPKPGSDGFFKILPEYPVSKGSAWRDTAKNETGTTYSEYLVKEISDSTIQIEYSSQSENTMKTEMMGAEIKTSFKAKTKGVMTLDRKTKLLKSRTENTATEGVAETSFGNLPLSSKSELLIRVQ
ncbi:MAG: DUF6263 family protein [Chitinophagaceae bacterium]|nr:DUF6263 family protein [Chitinophagaceae bacterium]